MKIWRCPKCKGRNLTVVAKMTVILVQNPNENNFETIDGDSDREWGSDATMICCDCDHSGVAKTFEHEHGRDDFGEAHDIIVRGDVKIDLSNLGEGLSGDYNPDDPDDINLLRFDVDKYDWPGREFVGVEDASYCTQIPATATALQKRKILKFLMDELYEEVTDGHPVKKLGERLSWISLDSLKKNAVEFGKYYNFRKRGRK